MSGMTTPVKRRKKASLITKKFFRKYLKKINAPILHPIIPVNAYAAAKGSFEKDEELIRKSNINELVEALNSFAASYRAESASALEARVMQLVASAGEQAVYIKSSWRK